MIGRGNFLFILLAFPCNGKILPCNTSIESEVCFEGVDNIAEYISTKSPHPLPTLSDIGLFFYDIIDVDEEEQTATFFMKIKLRWHDHRISVKQSLADIQK